MEPGPRSPAAPVGIVSTVEVTPPPDRPLRQFARWVAESIPPGARVINVGGGCNASGEFPAIRRRAGQLVAVDPSARVLANSDADALHQLSLEEFAPDHAGEYDVAFAIFVMEHVRDPAGFTAAAAHVLRPGGAFLAITLNQWHYFGLATWATSRLGLNEWLLRQVREPDLVAEYHVPTEYRVNTIRSTTRYFGRAGFSRLEFRMWDLPQLYEPYLPRPCHGFASQWHRAAYRLHRPNFMGHLTYKAIL